MGRRARCGWELAFAPGETLADAPRVRVRRKIRDFEFPPVNGTDPFLVYDSAAFPPPGTVARELPAEEALEGDNRLLTVTETAAAALGDRTIEVLRRTTTTTLGPDDRPLRQRVVLLESGPPETGLEPHAVYYYQLAGPALAADDDPAAFRATARIGEAYGLNRTLYESLPAIVRRHDTTSGPVTPNAEAVPEAARRSGQLRRFLDAFGAALDFLRSGAEGLRDLHDLDRVDYRRLPLLAQWIGWDLSRDASIPLRRHEIRYAAALYRMTGTVPGCKAWVKRLTGWSAEIREFHENVLLTNHVGAAEDPGDRGSSTVDTSDAELLARMGTAEDEVDYTYDTGRGDDDWFAFNTVGLFVRPLEGESAEEVARKRERLSGNLSIFLPFNIRGVVIVEVERRETTGADRLNLREEDGD